MRAEDDFFNDPHFAALRDMDTFTDDMFNRIVAFQERKHAAWDENRPFSERIAGLPLHYIVFSNPDRNPATHAHTVAPYYPLRDELRMIAHCVRQVAAEPIVWDVYPGNGFIGSLLAREGVQVVGTRDPAAKMNQIANFFDTDFYQMREISANAADFAADAAFVSWMPAGLNSTPMILTRNPKLIVFVFNTHTYGEGKPITGTPEAFSDLPDHYTLIAEWEMTRPENLFHDPWPDLTPSPEENRCVRIYAREDYAAIDVKTIQPATPYDWEKELNMALLAIEAKNIIRKSGFKI